MALDEQDGQDPQQGEDDAALKRRMAARAAARAAAVPVPAAGEESDSALAARMAARATARDSATGHASPSVASTPVLGTPAAPIQMAPVVVKPTARRVAAEGVSEMIRGAYGRDPAAVTVDPTGGIVATGRPLEGRQRIVDALTAGGDVEGLGQLAGTPALGDKIANRLALARSHNGVELAPRPKTFAETGVHLALNGAASMMGLGAVANADDAAKLDAWAANGGDPSEVLIGATPGTFDPGQQRNVPGTPAVTRADVLALLSAGGTLAGIEGVNKVLGPLGGVGGSVDATQAGATEAVRQAARANEVASTRVESTTQAIVRALAARKAIGVDVLKTAATSGAAGAVLGGVDAATSGERDPAAIAAEVAKAAGLWAVLGAATHGLAAEGQFREGQARAARQLERTPGLPERLAHEKTNRTPTADRTPVAEIGKRPEPGGDTRQGVEIPVMPKDGPPAPRPATRGATPGVTRARTEPAQPAVAPPVAVDTRADKRVDTSAPRVRTRAGEEGSIEAIDERGHVTVRLDDGTKVTAPADLFTPIERAAPAPAPASDEVAASSAPAQAGAPAAKTASQLSAEQWQKDVDAAEPIPRDADASVFKTATPAQLAKHYDELEDKIVGLRGRIVGLRNAKGAEEEDARMALVRERDALDTRLDLVANQIHQNRLARVSTEPAPGHIRGATRRFDKQQHLDVPDGTSPEAIDARVRSYYTVYRRYSGAVKREDGDTRDYQGDIRGIADAHQRAMNADPDRAGMARHDGNIWFEDAKKLVAKKLKAAGVKDVSPGDALEGVPHNVGGIPKEMEAQLPEKARRANMFHTVAEIDVDHRIRHVIGVHEQQTSAPKQLEKPAAEESDEQLAARMKARAEKKNGAAPTPTEPEGDLFKDARLSPYMQAYEAMDTARVEGRDADVPSLRAAAKAELKKLAPEDRTRVTDWWYAFAGENVADASPHRGAQGHAEGTPVEEMEASWASAKQGRNRAYAMKLEAARLNGAQSADDRDIADVPRTRDEIERELAYDRKRLARGKKLSGIERRMLEGSVRMAERELAELDAAPAPKKTPKQLTKRGGDVKTDSLRIEVTALKKAIETRRISPTEPAAVALHITDRNRKVINKRSPMAVQLTDADVTALTERLKSRERELRKLEAAPEKSAPKTRKGKHGWYEKLSVGDLLEELVVLQAKVDDADRRFSEGHWVRVPEDGAPPISGGSLASGMAKTHRDAALKRIDEVETRLRAAGIDDEDIQAARFDAAHAAELAEEQRARTDGEPTDGDTDFDFGANAEVERLPADATNEQIDAATPTQLRQLLSDIEIAKAKLDREAEGTQGMRRVQFRIEGQRSKLEHNVRRATARLAEATKKGDTSADASDEATRPDAERRPPVGDRRGADAVAGRAGAARDDALAVAGDAPEGDGAEAVVDPAGDGNDAGPRQLRRVEVQKTLDESGTAASTEDVTKLMAAAERVLLSRGDFGFQGPKALRLWAADILGRPYESETWKMDDVYDAIEGAVNVIALSRLGPMLVGDDPNLTGPDSRSSAQAIEEQLFGGRLRSSGMLAMQQFSTPLPIARAAQLAAGVLQGERVLEPTAGTGNLVNFLRDAGIYIDVNELEPRRVAVLRALGLAPTTEDALRLPLNGKRYNAIITNPPYGAHKTGKYSGQGATPFADSDVSQRFIAAAMQQLVEGGRLVAVMPPNVLLRSAQPFRQWLQANHTPIAYIASPPDAYSGRGTDIGTVLMVVDKGRVTAEREPKFFYEDVVESWETWENIMRFFEPGGKFARTSGRGVAVDVKPIRVPTRQLGGPKKEATLFDMPADAPDTQATEVVDGGNRKPVAGRDRDAAAGAGAEPGIAGGAAPVAGVQPERSAAGSRARPLDRGGRGADVVAVEASGDERAADDSRAPGLVPELSGGRVDADAGRAAGRESELEAARNSAVFAPYALGDIARRSPHPRLVVETRAMAGMPAPAIRTKLESKAVDAAWSRPGQKGGLSDEQVDAVLRGTSAWENGHGILIADDVGVGKAREAGALILEAIARGATRIIYTTKNENNVADAMAEFRLVASGKEDGAFPATFVLVGDYKGAKDGTESLPRPAGPVVYLAHSYNFGPYAEALAEVQPDTWIADEAHEYKNQFATRGMAWQALHRQMLANKDARFAYLTATPAVTLDELGYLYGLREWVPGGFADWVDTKLGKKDAAQPSEQAEGAAEASGADIRAMGDRSEDTGNLRADDAAVRRGTRRFMRGRPDVFGARVSPAETEQVMRELKGAGKYIARDLWRGGVQFDIHPVDLLGPDAAKERALYDQAAELTRDISMAARKFGRMNARVKTAGLDRALIQSYLKQLLFGMRLPTVLDEAGAALQRGMQVVISLHSVTGDVDPEEGVSEADAETPLNERLRSAINRINTQEVKKTGSGDEAVFEDLGEIPEAIIARADLLDRLGQLPPLIDPVRAMEDRFGPKQLAVITGKRTAKQRKAAMGDFQGGTRRVAVISKAGKVGISLHDVNGRRRRMLVADYEWSADTFKQELGRVDRTGQKSSPHVSLVASNLAGERKFAATIAARMASLGATSKGSAESTGTDALDQFDVADGISLTAMRATVNVLSPQDRMLFTGSKFTEVARTTDGQWIIRPKQMPDVAGMRDFLLELMMFPVAASDRVWAKWVEQRDELRTGDTAAEAAARRTSRAKGTVTRRVSLTAPGEPPLMMVEVKNDADERRAVLQGFVTPYINEIQTARGTDDMGRTKSRRYVHVTTPEGELVTGLDLSPAEARRVKLLFGKGERRTISPDDVWEDLTAGEDVAVRGVFNAPWSLHPRRDGRIQIYGATLAKHQSAVNKLARYETVGNYLYVPNDKAAVLAFLERFPAQQPEVRSKGGGQVSEPQADYGGVHTGVVDFYSEKQLDALKEQYRPAFDGAYRIWQKLHDESPKPMAGDDMLRAFHAAAKIAAVAMNRLMRRGWRRYRSALWDHKPVRPVVVETLAMGDAGALADLYLNGGVGQSAREKATAQLDNDRNIIRHYQDEKGSPYIAAAERLFEAAEQHIAAATLGVDADGVLPADERDLEYEVNTGRSTRQLGRGRRVEEPRPEYDLFGDAAPEREPEQASMFGDTAGTEASRSLAQTESAARSELAKLRAKGTALTPAEKERAAILDKLVSRGNKISEPRRLYGDRGLGPLYPEPKGDGAPILNVTRLDAAETIDPHLVALRTRDGWVFLGPELEDAARWAVENGDIPEAWTRDKYGDFKIDRAQLEVGRLTSHGRFVPNRPNTIGEPEPKGIYGALKRRALAIDIPFMWEHIPAHRKFALVRALGFHQVIANTVATTKKWEDVQPAVREQLEPAVKAEVEHSYREGGWPWNKLAEQQPEYNTHQRFYSRLERAIESSPMARGTAEQWKAAVSKNVARGELEWTGLEAWLAGQTGTVTREQVMAAFKARQIEVNVVELSDNPRRQPRLSQVAAADLMKKVDNLGFDNAGRAYRAIADHQNDWRRRWDVRDLTEQETDDLQEYAASFRSYKSKFGQYTEPGGTNYREMLLTLAMNRGEDMAAYAAASRALEQWHDRHPDGATAEPDRAEYSRLLQVRDGAFEEQNALRAAKSFRSSHFDQANIIAHIRLKDRTLPDGTRALHVEEIQSDWHEQGRRYGYDGDGKLPPGWQIRDVPNDVASAFALTDADGGHRGTFLTRDGAMAEAQRVRRTPAPDGPYKKTEEWAGLVLRHVIDEAVRGGYDRVIWTPGKLQADRYNLAKHVDELKYNETSKQLLGFKDGSPIISHVVAPDDLPDYVGKGVATKLLEQPEIDVGLMDRKWRTLKGEALQVGGQGMLGFYDQMVPKFIKAEAKRLGVELTIGSVAIEAPTERSPLETWQFRRGASIELGRGNDVLSHLLSDVHDAMAYEGRSYAQALEGLSAGERGKVEAWVASEHATANVWVTADGGAEPTYDDLNDQASLAEADGMEHLARALRTAARAMESGNDGEESSLTEAMDVLTEQQRHMVAGAMDLQQTAPAGWASTDGPDARPVHQFPSFAVTDALRRKVLSGGQTIFERGPRYAAPAQPSLFDPASDAEHATIAFGSPEQAGQAAKQLAKEAPAVVQLRAAGKPVAPDRMAALRDADARAWVDLRGQVIDTAEKAAQLLHPFRNPRMERFHVLLLDYAGKVLSHSAVTSGALAEVRFGDRFVPDVLARARRVGAVRAIIAHNHPSGDPTPSAADKYAQMNMGFRLQQAGIRLEGQLVLDHTKASWLSLDVIGGDVGLRMTDIAIPDVSGPDWTESTSEKAWSPAHVARYMADAMIADDGFVVLHLDVQHRAIALEPHNARAMRTMSTWLPQRMKANASGAIIIAAQPAVAARVAALVSGVNAWSNAVLDVIGLPSGDRGRYISHGESGLVSSGRADYLEPESRSARSVFEEGPKYGAGKPGDEDDADRVDGTAPLSGAGDDGTAPRGRRSGTGAAGRVPDDDGVAGDHPTPDASGLSHERSSIRLREILPAIRALIHPEGLGDVAKGTAGTIRHETARSFRGLTIAREALRDFAKKVDKLSRPAAVKYWDDAENGRPTGDADMDAGNALLHEVTARVTDELIKLGRLNAESAMEHYVGRFWSKPTTPQARDFLRAIFAKRPLEGPKSFLKRRSLELFTDGLDAGLIPATYNYVESQLAKIAEMERLIAATRIMQIEAQHGRARKVMDQMGKRPPLDENGDPWVRLGQHDDPAFTIFGPRTGAVILPAEAKEADIDEDDVGVLGRRVLGHWYVPKQAAAVWNAHLSRGLRGNPLYDAFMAPVQATAQLLLGLSGFHFTVIATEGVFSDLALGIDSLVNAGVPASGAPKQLARAAVAPVATAGLGIRVMDEYKHPGMHPELARVLDHMIAGGFRGTAKSEFWTGERKENFRRAFKDALHAESKGRRLWGLARLPVDALWAGLELASVPLMEKYVPYMKTGATYLAVAQALKKLPADASMDTIHRMMSEITAEMDYRFGQVVYDNHFINNVVKHLAQVVFLAPGWTFGTLALMERGARDLVRPVIRGARAVRQLRAGGGGKGGGGGNGAAAAGDAASDGASGDPTGSGTKVSDTPPPELVGKSAAYWIGAVLGTMFINGVLTYINTGEQPHGKDYFAFRDGTLDADGNGNRHTIPGYLMHDVYGWAHHPVKTFTNKLSPVLAFLSRVAQNRTFFGDQVYDPDAPPLKKARQLGGALVDQVEPLSVQNFREGAKRGETGPGEMARSFFGVGPAKREFQRTAAQNKMNEYLALRGHTARTPDEAAAAEGRRDIGRAFREGTVTRDSVRQLEKAGTLTERQADAIVKTKRGNPLLARFKMLNAEQAARVYELGTPEEQKLWERVMRGKRRQLERQKR